MATARERRDPFADAARELSGPAQVGPPVIAPLAGGVGYAAHFKDAMARIAVDGLRQGREGLRGELTVEVGPFGDGGWRTLTGGRMELNSMSQRETWERRLRKRWPGTDWEAVLDRFCASILLAEKRLDRPAILLRDAGRPVSDEMLLPPILHGRLPTLWYGGDGTLKSYVALAAGLGNHCGDGYVGGLRPSRTLRLLFADFEFDAWDHRERMRRLVGGSVDDPNETMPDVAYIDCRGATLVNQVERIQRAARQFGSEFLVVDSISYAAEGPLNEDETARLYYRALGQIGLPSLSTAHVPKNGDIMRPFGSAHWRNLCRLAWHFQRVDLAEHGFVGLKLTNTKNSTEEIERPIGLRVHFDKAADRVSIERTQIDQLAAAGDEIWRRVKALLIAENRAMTYDQIAAALAETADAVSPRIREHPETFVILGVEGSRKKLVGLVDAKRRDP